MKTLFLLLVVPVAMAQSAFDGTWKVDLGKSQFSTKPDVFVLLDGRYSCPTCLPPIDVKADGTDQPVAGHPRYDTMRVDVVDNRTVIITEKKNGKTVQTLKTVISQDGNTADWEFGSNLASDHPVTGKGQDIRVGPGPAGSHVISGSWRSTKMEGVSDSGLLFTYKVTGDVLAMTTPAGRSFTAKLDGSEAPYKGDPATTSVSVKRLDENTLEETDRDDGKVKTVSRITLSADGKALTIASTDKQQGTTELEVADRQVADSSTNSELEREKTAITQLEDEWLTALNNADVDAIAKILADDFVRPAPDPSRFVDKADLLSFYRSHLSRQGPDKARIENMTVTIYGHTALARGELTTTDTGGRIIRRLLFTDIFVQRDGKWQAVSAQENPVTGPQISNH